MNSSLCVASGFVAVILLGASPSNAQTPTPPPNIAVPQPSPYAAVQNSAPITLTGCLERSKPLSLADKGKTPPPSNVDPATAYVLRSESSAGAPDNRGVLYNLIATGPSVRLEQHRGHRVQISGTLRMTTNQQPGLSNQGVSPSTPSGSTGMETMPKADPTAAHAGVPSVTQPIFVESLKMLDGGCKSSTE